ncbi:MAG: bifunctional anthranilate synthase component II/anthranilate phosphoribosyltransferase [Methanobrevibacter sp.]|uniref:bifunctional anthranilate synthase component II/anthranilate phosphoribosyltransferase n=1 Tax=Methanobrevibacter sp. TaxID=66852 RepID=UPI0026E0FCF0|nr:bifunctional anthranilate synthase component II/anthranilate phosphoribosyltransferase [Methanobrevibacter sp.]MDO5848004.1 bifunctional anthranilate synthase component II/anthranilate phosphoribosyltransferase [Methanobrevibacter sp.]
MIVLIDNYDSFSYNLYQLIGEINQDIKVFRNDKVTLNEIRDLNPEAIILSPGPGRPEDAGICIDVVKEFAGDIPILGVCLGHQAICAAFGGNITYADKLMHGKSSIISFDEGDELFKNLESPITVGRYHSLSLKDEIPEELEVISTSDDGEIMAVRHKQFPVYGLQFHPESILTPDGLTIVKNFLGDYTINKCISKLAEGEDLTYREAYKSMDEIMSGKASEIEISSYLTALSIKGETIEEISASAEAMRNHALKFETDLDVLEIVGTGGDKSNSFNISTTSSIIISAAGVPITKHGNRSASSKCGAADVLEELGVNIYLGPEESLEVFNEANICFLFAQTYHKAMKHVANVRSQLGIKTIFNILGPLTNPANAKNQVLGVYSEELVEPLANVLLNLGIKSAMVVYGQDCLDEISISDKTTVCEIKDSEISKYEISPEDFGIPLAKKQDIVGGDAKTNAEITLNILKGKKGPQRDAVLMNSAAGLYTAGKVDSLDEGIRLAEEIIDSGKALEQLNKFIKLTND